MIESETLNWYLEFIRRELEKLEQGKFTGNVGFKVNFKEGGIANMNIELNKSVKMVTKDE